ncbi:hypothetical protein TVAG_462510 [Trichomonas vaginalis G3]|uniref:Uncharacterized protein n=1 Tax=Trichomonas vaginalis (strain ATCC PRA-98 / G3) TaxID=412133 RepID=A2DLW2_TRIV3|nr:hypothetical protein TVAGG3_1012380 [Trichomonas vaginalis G3]EAY18565.1 hypothetical protein TVAG_462510 [Trichomonas vaginalis G3]KAI5491592.1 hypothetical protein TVAGG3_1012380 [Trichomonas vaginalis G3]|eukprot:XP_001579551.1 hypothetical protein [Trichomonas vaginalis G3]
MFLEPEDEFQQPEYLQQQKNILILEINQLKSEIQPLSNKYNQLLEEMNKNNTSDSDQKSSEFSQENYISSQLKELHQENDILIEDLAKLRRNYSTQMEKSLNSDILYQKQCLEQLQIETNQCTSLNDKIRAQLDEILKADYTYLIQEHKKSIDLLKSQLSTLQADESKMIQSYMEITNDMSVITEMERTVSQKRSQLKNLEHQKMRINLELRRVKKDYEFQVMRLENEIAEKENSIRNKLSRDNWRKSMSSYSKSKSSSNSSKMELNSTQENNSQSNIKVEEPQSPLLQSPRVKFHESTVGHGIPLDYAIANSIIRPEIVDDDKIVFNNTDNVDEDDLLDLEPLIPSMIKK